jgi:CubicO group peptidase (beta-lactamase class C family)
MKKIISLIAVVLITHLSFSQDLSAKLDELITAYSKQYKFNGSALVAKNGTVLLDKGYGLRNAADKIPNDPTSIFQLGSITKQFTSTIILKLQAEKKLNVKDKLSKYFPKYPKGDSITIEQLLSHTSGIYNYTNDGNFMTNEITKPASREKIMAMFENKPLDFSPGTNWSYSNSGYSLLGYIIEVVTKKSYEQVVRNYIFKPLQMTHSGFDFTHLKVPEKTTGYFKLDDKTNTVAPIVDSTVSFSAGAIYSTTGDLYKWHKALENYSILSKAQQEQAYTPVRNGYGYGWGIDSIDGKRGVGHGGGIHGYITNITRVPADDACIIVLSNASNEAVGKLSKDILNLLYNKPYELPKEKVSITLPEEKLKEYVGEYEIRPDLHVAMTVKDGLLIAAPTGQPSKELYAEKEDFFFEKTEDIQVEFTRNDKKEVDAFVLHQGGQTVKCKKIK